jgi:chaperonin GroES
MADLKGKILAGKILVETDAAEEKTVSGIIIPDSAQEKPQMGTVVLVGDGKTDEPMELKVGDAVLYSKFGRIEELNIDGNDYLLMSQTDVLYIS